MNVIIAAVFLIFVSTCNGIVVNSPCRTNVPSASNFNITEYMGKWYEIERYEQLTSRNSDCVTAEYSLNPNSSVNVLNKGIQLVNRTNNEDLGIAVLTYPNMYPPIGMLNVSFNNMPNDRANYMVVGTDYHSYSIVWSCGNLNATHSREFYWLLSRTPQVENATTMQSINLVKSVIQLSNAGIRTTNQTEEACRRNGGFTNALNGFTFVAVLLLAVTKF